MSRLKYHAVFSTAAAALLICSCSSGDDFSGSYRVTKVSALEHKLKPGEETRVDVLFTTKLRPDNTPAPLELLISLPPGLSYTTGSARLYSGEALTDSLRRDPTELMKCPDGSEFLRFLLAETELEARGPEGDGSRQKLRIQVMAGLPAQNVVQSSAGSREPFSCTKQFTGEQREIIFVE